MAAAPVHRSAPERDAHVSWIVLPERATTVDGGNVVDDPSEAPHFEEYFAEASCFDTDDYASTADPGSDDESLLDLSDPGGDTY